MLGRHVQGMREEMEAWLGRNGKGARERMVKRGALALQGLGVICARDGDHGDRYDMSPELPGRLSTTGSRDNRWPMLHLTAQRPARPPTNKPVHPLPPSHPLILQPNHPPHPGPLDNPPLPHISHFPNTQTRTWKPPESVSMPRGHPMNSCSPFICATSSDPGLFSRWYVLPRMTWQSRSSSCWEVRPFTDPGVWGGEKRVGREV